MNELKIGETFVDGGNTYEVVGKNAFGFSSRLVKIGADDVSVTPKAEEKPQAAVVEAADPELTEAEEKAKRAKRTEAATKARLAKLAAKKAKEAAEGK